MAAMFGLLILLNLKLKPLLIVDETRYLAVAWEMWRDGNFLVPKLNGEFYTHKPPFLFWLMHLGWSVFGVNDWWPRLLAPIAFALDALLIGHLSRRLFPDLPHVSKRATYLFLGTLFPVLFMTNVMFDLWVVLWVLLGLTALVNADRGTPLGRSILLAALAMGMGIVCKGPVLLLYLLPPALAAKHWCRRPKAVLLTGLLGLLGGALLALAWAIPAGLVGGPAYREAIFWGQTAGRMQNSFDHARPFYWYLPLLPIMLYPWIWWPRAFVGWKALRLKEAAALRLMFWAVVPAFLVFSVISGKQPHYLLPLFPMLLIALACNLEQKEIRGPRSWYLPMWLPAILGGTLVTAPWWLPEPRNPVWLSDQGLWLGGGFLLFFTLQQGRLTRLQQDSANPLFMMSLGIMTATLVVLFPKFRATYDIQPISEYVAELQEQGTPLAFYGTEYAGQFHFYGRLTDGIANPHAEKGLVSWLDANPNGALFQVIRRDEEPPYGFTEWPAHEFGSRRIQVWDAAALRAVIKDRGR